MNKLPVIMIKQRQSKLLEKLTNQLCQYDKNSN